MIQLLTARAVERKQGWEEGSLPCHACGKPAVQVLMAGDTESPVAAITMCQEHLIKVEALLRGARKHGPRVGQWGGGK